jgi:hypothetical protein
MIMDTLSTAQIEEYEKSLSPRFRTFNHYLSHANKVAIKAWLRSYVPHTQEHQNIFLKLLESHHIHLLTQVDGVNDQQVKDSRLAILKHLDGMAQLSFNRLIFKIDSAFDNDYLKIMTVPYQKEDKDNFFNDRFWPWYSTFQLHYEKFSVIDDIETFFQSDFLQTQHQSFILFFPEEKKTSLPSNYTSWRIVLDDCLLSPYYDVIFNYSVAKETYLNGKGIYMPDIEQIMAIEQALVQRSQMYSHQEALIAETLAGIKECNTVVRYRKIKDSIEQKYGSKADNERLTKPPKI